LSDDLSDDELKILRDCGLMTRCPGAFNTWNERNSKDKAVRLTNMKVREAEGKKNLIGQDVSRLQTIYLKLAIDDAVATFP
jgi:hypothetical protein